MEKDEYNILAAKELKARLCGEKSKASEYKEELAALRKGKKIRLSKKSESDVEKGGEVDPSKPREVVVIAPLDANGNLLTSLVKKV
jgi:hypothetical protein